MFQSPPTSHQTASRAPNPLASSAPVPLFSVSSSGSCCSCTVERLGVAPAAGGAVPGAT